MTLVTAQLFKSTQFCCVNDENENNLQIHADVHTLYCYRYIHCTPGKLFKQIKTNNMKANMSSADRTIRLIIAGIIAILFFTDVVGGTLGIILIALAAVFALTSIVSFCPLYALFGISTCPVSKQ